VQEAAGGVGCAQETCLRWELHPGRPELGVRKARPTNDCASEERAESIGRLLSKVEDGKEETFRALA
jgi:hypothetical protein